MLPYIAYMDPMGNVVGDNLLFFFKMFLETAYAFCRATAKIIMSNETYRLKMVENHPVWDSQIHCIIHPIWKHRKLQLERVVRMSADAAHGISGKRAIDFRYHWLKSTCIRCIHVFSSSPNMSQPMCLLFISLENQDDPTDNRVS